MTVEIALVLAILLAAVVLFVSERFRVDVVALLVFSALVVTGLVTPSEAVSGFSNPAVITVWAVFILSGGLTQTGVANLIGQNILRFAGSGYTRLLIIVMLISGVLSAFMNNVGVVAMLLPVILDISRRTGFSPSKLLLPAVFGSLLGGMTTLISTPSNILISDALAAAGWEPFGLFDYTPAGAALLVAGTLFMLLVGSRLLPDYKPVREFGQRPAIVGEESPYALEERLAVISVPPRSRLAGKTLAESRIGAALGLNILSVRRNSDRQITPHPDTLLREGDRLLVLGRLDRLDALVDRPSLVVTDQKVALGQLFARSDVLAAAEYRVVDGSRFAGQTLAQADVRQQYGLTVLAVERNGGEFEAVTQEEVAEPGDRVLLVGPDARVRSVQDTAGFRRVEPAEVARLNLERCLLAVQVPPQSLLSGRSLLESRLANTFGLNAVAIIRDERTLVLPGPNTELREGDTLVVTGDAADLELVRGLQELEVEREPEEALALLKRHTGELAEVVLSPFTTLVGKTLRDLRFREKYGLSVLAIWRGGRPYRTDLATMPLRLGDALLVYGSRERIQILGREPDFLVLEQAAQEEPRYEKAWIAGLLMVSVILTVLVGWLPISVAAIVGATLMVVTGCLTMDEAYRFIEWKAVFLIAAMLPLGIAMENTGAANLVAETLIGLVGPFGPYAIMAGLFVLTVAATQFMPNPVVAVLLAPITLSAAAGAGFSPYPFMLALAFAVSSSFLTPVGHPANVLVMGPGGYRFGDYPRVGLPLAVVLLVVTLLVVPLLWPF